MGNKEEEQASQIEREIRLEARKAKVVISRNTLGATCEDVLLLRYAGVYVAAKREDQWQKEAVKAQRQYLRCIGEHVKVQRQIHESVKAALSKIDKTQRVVKKIGNLLLENRFRSEQRLSEVHVLLAELIKDTRSRGSLDDEKRMFATSNRPAPASWWQRESISTRVLLQWYFLVAKEDPDRQTNMYALAWCWALTKAEEKEEFWRDLRRKLQRIRESGRTQVPYTPWGGPEIWRPRRGD